MDNAVETLIGGMVCVILAFNAVLPATATAIWGTYWNGTQYVGTATTPANLSTGNLAMATVIPTVVILMLVIYFVRAMIG